MAFLEYLAFPVVLRHPNLEELQEASLHQVVESEMKLPQDHLGLRETVELNLGLAAL